jgi:cytochrome c oxidase assembly protein subunit 15
MLLEPAWRNFFENPKTVQFVHRVGAYLLVLFIIAQWLLARADDAPAPVRLRTAIMVWLALAQASLGVVTLMLQVPLPLALAHQAGAAIMLAFAVAHWRAVHGTYAPVTMIEVRS